MSPELRHNIPNGAGSQTVSAARSAPRGYAHGRPHPVRRPRRQHLARRQAGSVRDAKLHVLSHGLHYASCVFEGERAYDGTVFKLTRAQPAPGRLGGPARHAGSLDGGRHRRRDPRGRARQRLSRRLCPPDHLARFRDDGRDRAGRQAAPGDRGLGMAVLFLARGAQQGHPSHDWRSGRARRPTPRRPRRKRVACT